MKLPQNQNEFDATLGNELPPSHWNTELQALWWDAKGDWDRAHALVDNPSTPVGTWVHAYLHRKEGDLWNADYWYARAGRKRPSRSLEEEFNWILSEVLGL